MFNHKLSYPISIMISRTIHTHCRRALLNVPGNDMRKLEKAIGLSVDTIVLDLEDGVPLNKKDIARENIIQLVRNHGEMISKNKELVIRMNHINTKDGILDIEHCIRKCSNAINSIILPKVDQTKDLDMYYTALKNTSFKWLICIESPLAIINLKEITSLYLEKVDGLIFGAEDYCAASGITRTSSLKELHYPRSALVTTALAYGIDAIDLVTIDYKSVQALRDESLDGKQLGFTGKVSSEYQDYMHLYHLLASNSS